MAEMNLQGHYRCSTCIYASDIQGRNCRKNMLSPVLLLMLDIGSCPFYVYDDRKARESLGMKDSHDDTAETITVKTVEDEIR